MKLASIGFVLVLVGLSVGCGPDRSGRRTAGLREVPRPVEPPAPPPRQDVPLDPSLAADARRTVNEALRHSDPLVRTQALEALRHSPPGPQRDRAIVAALDDPRPIVRFAAAMMAGELQVAAARPALLGHLDDSDAGVEVAVRFALHRLGDTRRTNDLVKLAASEDPRTRRNVALALGLLGEKSGLKLLRVLRTDDDPLVRQQAIEAMWRLGDESALKPLVALTISRYVDDEMIGLLALAAPGRQNVRGHVAALLTTDYVEVNLVAARAMGMLGSDAGYKIAQDAAASKDPQQRFLAALALGAIGRADAQDELRKLLAAPEPNVRLAAATAILQLNAESHAAGAVRTSGKA